MARYKRNQNIMDSITPPDKTKISELSGGFVDSKRVHKETGIDDFTNQVRADFHEAAPIKVPERIEGTEKEKDELDKYLEEQERQKQLREKTKAKGVKVGKSYVAGWLVKKIVIIAVVLLVLFIAVVPPICTNSQEGSTQNVNVFEKQSYSQLKENLLSDWSVYNIDNMSSEKAANYRVCTVGINMGNYSPFKIVADGFSVVTVDPTYKDKIVAVRVPGGKIELSPFKVETLTVEVLVNVHELSSEQLDEAMTSLVLKTSGMWKKAGPLPIPCIPAFVFVSDALEYIKQ